MSDEIDPDEFAANCLCQMKVVPEDKRIDFIALKENHKGKLEWAPILRFHKDCPYHGVKVTYAERTESTDLQ